MLLARISSPGALRKMTVPLARWFDWVEGSVRRLGRLVLGLKKGGNSKSAAAQVLRIGVATAGRFHLLDLARELDALGADVRFYSYVPRKRAEMFGLPRHCHVALLPFLFPLVALERLYPTLCSRTVERLMCWGLDMLVIARMQRCDVFVCMSGIYVQAPRFAKWRYGARIALHRGSRHILSQREILTGLPVARRPTPLMVQRELAGYALADQIVVPAAHVMDSFAPWPEYASKLIANPYGVDLLQFPLRNGSSPSKGTVLFVGHWSYRKGADVLMAAIDQMEHVRLIHVGPVVNIPFPKHPRYFHHDAVQQWELKKFYHSAQVFAIASREEGLAVVQVQALASGLPLVCTDRTGGADLARIAGLDRLIKVVPAGDTEAFRAALSDTFENLLGTYMTPTITDAERTLLSWRAYAIRHVQAIYAMLDGEIAETFQSLQFR